LQKRVKYVPVNGYLAIGTFSTSGPTKCSGLDVRQYSKATLTHELQRGFEKLRCRCVRANCPSAPNPSCWHS
jgi:hypothetical protein